MRPWIGPLAFFLIACGSSNSNENNVAGPTSATENPIYADLASQSSTDGQKVAFLSRRDAGAYRVYLYNESAEPKLFALSKIVPLEPATDELATSLSEDGNWILTWRSGVEKNELLLNSFDGSQKTTLTLSSSARLRGLSLAPQGLDYFAYTERKAGVDSVRIYSFSTTGTPVVAEEAVLTEEYGAQFAVVGSDLYVFTRKLSTNGSAKVQYRKRVGPAQWSLDASTTTLSAADVESPTSASALGLLFASNLANPRLKTKQGTFANKPVGYQENVGIVQEVAQFQAFSTSPINLTGSIYRANEPLTLSNISTTPDGAYLLVSGYDAWFCKSRTVLSNLLLLLRVNDGAVLPLFVARETGKVPWTDLLNEPCAYFDQTTITRNLDFDTTLGQGQIVSVTGNRVTMLFESKITGDREIRRLSFDVTDWTAKTYAAPVFTDISANPRL